MRAPNLIAAASGQIPSPPCTALNPPRDEAARGIPYYSPHRLAQLTRDHGAVCAEVERQDIELNLSRDPDEHPLSIAVLCLVVMGIAMMLAVGGWQ